MLNPQPQAAALDPGLIDVTSLALEVSRSQEVIDQVTIVRGYWELSVLYPENARFHDEVLRSLVRLSHTLESKGEQEVALKVRSVAASNR